MYFSLAFKLIFEIVILGKSVAATLIEKMVLADLEDRVSRVECNDKDDQEILAAAKSGNIKMIRLLLSQGFKSGVR